MSRLPIQIQNRPLQPSFYDASPESVARGLLGKALVRSWGDEVAGGIIVETEAYLATQDPASHSHRGPTRRNRSMFGPPGTLYVYTIHAKYCMNAVTEAEGTGSAVLIRAIEPVWGLAAMRLHRGQSDRRRLCRGPAMLCQALGVDLGLDGANLCDTATLWIEAPEVLPPFSVRAHGRIGIRHAAELPLRFFVDGNRFVSGRAGDHSVPARESLFDLD